MKQYTSGNLYDFLENDHIYVEHHIHSGSEWVWLVSEEGGGYKLHCLSEDSEDVFFTEGYEFILNDIKFTNIGLYNNHPEYLL